MNTETGQLLIPLKMGKSTAPQRWSKLKRYSDLLTADVNEKGVLDVDTVKGCSAGMGARHGTGCYGGCYAASIARFRGMNFARSVSRTVQSAGQARKIERAVRNAPEGFFRIGTMGDPCHDWEHTVRVIEWLAPLAVPVIVTKHWYVATDDHVARMIACGTVLNTSVSALDTPEELAHREVEIARYASAGGVSVARIVSCDFNAEHPEGREMADVQRRLFTLDPIIDNPLRVPSTHELVQRGVVRVRRVFDINTERSMSLWNPNTYVGKCGDCPEKCGLAFCGPDHARPAPPQTSLL